MTWILKASCVKTVYEHNGEEKQPSRGAWLFSRIKINVEAVAGILPEMWNRYIFPPFEISFVEDYQTDFNLKQFILWLHCSKLNE